MKKVLKLILTLTMVFSLLCTPVFAETTNIGIINTDPVLEEDYFSEFIELLEEIEDIEEDDEKDLEELFNQIVVLEEKLEDKWQLVENILSKYIDTDELGDFFDEVDPEYGSDEENQDDEGTLIISYSIKDGKMNVDEEPELEKEEHIKFQNDTESHKKIWELIKGIVPSEYLHIVTHFQINTDGKEGTLAHVNPTEEGDNSKWMISVDMADGLKNNGNLDKKELIDTIIHEFAHLLTLNSDEIDAREPEENESTFVTMEGVTKEKSYLNQFYQKFWKDIFDEWEEIEAIEDDDEYYDAQEEFYEKYKTRFVSDYAATNPGEDIAETFRIFVMDKKPRGKTIGDKKILFLYSFPELVKMREDIRDTM